MKVARGWVANVTDSSATQRIANWITDYGIAALVLLLGTLFGLSGLCTSDEFSQTFFSSYPAWHPAIKGWAFGCSVLFGLLALVAGCYQMTHQTRITMLEHDIGTKDNRIAELEDENRLIVENVRTLVEGYLLRLATGALDFGKHEENTERVTIYAYDPAGFFFSLGRYSPHATFNEVGKSEHAIDCGCIGKAWENGWCFDADFPNPETGRTTYFKKQANYGFDRETVDDFSMKSRLYCGCRILDRANSKPIAVLLIESTDQQRFTEEELKGVLLRDEVRYLSDLIEGVRDFVTNPSTVSKLGY